MKTTFAIVALACITVSMSGCGSSPQNLIVGKWEAGQAGNKITAEFTKDGKATLTMFGKALHGTYKVNGGDELEWTLNGTTTKHKVKVTSTELEATSEGNTITYKKV
jgi:uncharacterized protein (TIGR03066 family)